MVSPRGTIIIPSESQKNSRIENFIHFEIVAQIKTVQILLAILPEDMSKIIKSVGKRYYTIIFGTLILSTFITLSQVFLHVRILSEWAGPFKKYSIVDFNRFCGDESIHTLLFKIRSRDVKINSKFHS
jgi:hypothetical protein